MHGNVCELQYYYGMLYGKTSGNTVNICKHFVYIITAGGQHLAGCKHVQNQQNQYRLQCELISDARGAVSASEKFLKL